MTSAQKLQTYYELYYPYDSLKSYLTNNTECAQYPLSYREFSYSVSGTDTTIYKRWISFETIELLRDELVRVCPEKFDIGAVYSFRVDKKDTCLRPATQFQPLYREFVLDIDMNDYDSIRTCCKGKQMCQACWKFIVIAAEIIEQTFRDDFGFTNILWVFSGRRGIHCWVNDSVALKLRNEHRSAIITYLSRPAVPELTLKDGTRWTTCRLHKRVANILEKHFDQLLLDQTFLQNHNEKIHQFLRGALPLKKYSKLEDKVKKIEKTTSSTEFWRTISDVIVSCTDLFETANQIKAQLMSYFVYPKLDVNVSKDTSHLLKAPFCIHSATNKICLPMDFETLSKFNPNTCPTLSDIVDMSGNNAEFAHAIKVLSSIK